MVRLLGLGDNTVDTYVDAGLQYPGGNAVNVAVLAGRLGAESAYLGCLGDDAAGALLLRALQAEGLDLTRLRRCRGANARALIAHDGGDRRFRGSRPGVRAQYDLGGEDLAYVAGFDLTHTSIHSGLEAELPRLRKAACRLSIDCSERWTEAYLDRTLPFVDIAFLSAPRRSDAECAALLRACAARGPSLAVVTRGADGALAWADGQVLRQEAVPATIVDTLGAGDGFIAGFLVAYMRGASAPEALRAGAEMAAAVCGWQGAFGHGETWDGECDGIALPAEA
jgi:fructoselysine 6-kinase